MWELCRHPDYDHLYILLTSKSGKLQLQTNIFPGNNNPFSIRLLLSGSRFLKKIINFSGLRFRYHKLANRKKLILSLGNSFKTLKDMIIGTAGI